MTQLLDAMHPRRRERARAGVSGDGKVMANAGMEVQSARAPKYEAAKEMVPDARSSTGIRSTSATRCSATR